MAPSANGAVILGGRSTLDLPWQVKAWRFYGTPDGTSAVNIRTNRGAIGEVRFVLGWIAQQIARVGWFVKIDGRQLSATEAEDMMRRVANEQTTVTISTNLLVAGELNYICLTPQEIKNIIGAAMWEATVGYTLPSDEDKQWIAVSVVDPRRNEFFEAAKSGLNIRGIWPHPANQTSADPPLAGVLDVLEEIEQLQDLAYSQNRSRIANMGILTIANELELQNSLPNGAGTDVGRLIEDVINSPIRDPRKTSAAPIIFRAPFEYMTGALSNGARSVQWTRPDLEEYTMTLESRMKFAIQRLAWGFPVAPEILLGMTATNRAVAFQIEESTYRAYIEPICDLVGRVYARALQQVLEGEKVVEVLPDATDLLARRHSIADAKDLYDRGLVRAAYVRRVAGVPEEDAAGAEDLERIVLLRKGGPAGQPRELDPSEVAGNEPVRASAAYSSGALGYALEGALDMAYSQFLARVGAAARTRLQRQGAPAMELDPEIVPNRRLPSFLGPDRLEELGVDISQCERPVTEWLADWWGAQAEGYGQGAPFPGPLQYSTLELTSRFSQWCQSGACSWPHRVPGDLVPAVLDALGGTQHTDEPEPAVAGG